MLRFVFRHVMVLKSDLLMMSSKLLNISADGINRIGILLLTASELCDVG